ncbi:MAG: SAM-dependent methyltransferase [Acidobacteriota bacterium]
MVTTKAELTFKHNLNYGRHGWLRLTPAYSVKVVHKILEENRWIRHVLDPFSGSGTTGLACAEQNLNCDLLDINPFLIWFAEVKTANYSEAQCREARIITREIAQKLSEPNYNNELWMPAIKNIERWWPATERALLAGIYDGIHRRFPERTPVSDILLVAFCRTLIEWSNAAFNHQSMSFKESGPSLFDYENRSVLLENYLNLTDRIIESAASYIPGRVQSRLADSRVVHRTQGRLYDCVITSPPYPNRMSYIRELRPYMYWLGYLKEAKEAGELDWQAIGGTWGIATSRLAKWQPEGEAIRHAGFYLMIDKIAENSPLLANYVHKYFVDVVTHLHSVKQILRPGGKIFYVIGNSKFYDTLVPVEKIYADILRQLEFDKIEIEALRKRNSKKELVEFLVSAEKL